MGIAPNGRASRWLLMIAKPNLTQAELVRRGIEHAIFNGDLAPGVFLEEGRLATLYGVSRTPVREAIANLVRSGLLTKTAHRRAIVSQLDSGKLLELFEALAEMEGLAARFAASRMSHQEKASLMDIHQRAATLLPVGASLGGSSPVPFSLSQSATNRSRLPMATGSSFLPTIHKPSH